MGKGRAKRRHTALTPPGSSETARIQPEQPKAPKPGFTPGKTLLNSDVVTGEPLRPDTPKYVVGYVRVDWQPTRTQREDGWQNDTSDVPQAVSSAKVEHLSALGGRAWTPGFRRYIGDAKPVSVDEADAAIRDWWRSQYGVTRVMRKFVEHRGERRGTEAYRAAYTVRVLNVPVVDAAKALQRSADWVDEQCKTADRLMWR